MARPYQHEPLKSASSIRVVDLLPSPARNLPIICRIRQISLQDESISTPFEALSYVWGSDRNQSISVHGAKLLVTASCVEALRHLRYRFKKRTLWVDAICIDQGDGEESMRERNQQVALMGEVYRRAMQVIIWLGCGDEKVMPKVFKYLMWFQPQYRDNMIQDLDPTIAARLAAQIKDQQDIMEAYTQLLNHPWFSRVWTVQESTVALDAIVLCGRSTVRWLTFMRAVLVLREQADFPISSSIWKSLLFRNHAQDMLKNSEFWGHEHVWSTASRRDAGADVPDEVDVLLLSSICDFQSTKLHDKIYGLFALFPAFGLQLTPPDYTRDYVHLLIEMAATFVRERRNLNILLVTLPSPEERGYPSWIPNWVDGTTWDFSEKEDRSGLDIVYNFKGFRHRRWAASGASQALIPPTPPTRHLTVRGGLVGTIRFQIPANRTELPGFETVITNFTGNMQPFLPRRANYSLFVLDSEDQGLAYNVCHEGDQVWLLAGLKLPCILRRRGRDPDHFRFIALAYLDEAMDGQLWPEHEDAERWKAYTRRGQAWPWKTVDLSEILLV